MSKEQAIEKLALVLDDLFSQYDLAPEELLQALSKRKQEAIPLSAFSSKKLSTLEILVKYLKENRGKKYSEIASLLNRDDRTIWSTYNNSLKKFKGPLTVKGHIVIPISIFSDRELSTLETLVTYLKDKLGYSYKKIASLLNRNYQTVYTTYKRGMSK